MPYHNDGGSGFKIYCLIGLVFLLSTLRNVSCFVCHKENPFIQKKRILTKRSKTNNLEENAKLYDEIKFLGKGKEVTVEPGVVLVSPKFETSHFLSKTAILVLGVGLNQYGEAAVRGVMIDNPTPFTLSEMTGDQHDLGHLGNNILFRGGDSGKEKIMVIHDNPDIPSTPIGTDGMFHGGIEYAINIASDDNTNNNNSFKFFFNYIEYDVDSLVQILSEEENGDAWISVSVPSDLILNSDLDRGDAWRGIRTVMKDVYSN